MSRDRGQMRHEEIVNCVAREHGYKRVEKILHGSVLDRDRTHASLSLHSIAPKSGAMGPRLLTSLKMLEPATPIQYVKGVGPRLAEVLVAKGIATVDDLLHYLPFRYEDRLNPRSVAELRAGEMATVIAEVRNSGLFRTRRMPIFQLTVGQGRARLKCIWFNAAYLQDRFQAGQMLALYGKVEEDRDGELQIVQPQFEILGDININDEGGAQAAEKEAEKKVAASL